uniref:Peptidase C14 caspase domain-containing protein n=1 Tax=Anopheles coluzzii TaxID=1518534 RepID=A0A8W7NYD4_ANOCL
MNRTLAQLRQDLRSFGVLARQADISLFYYAGHGTAVENINYLIPVDQSLARLNSALLRQDGLSLRFVESEMRGPGSKVSVLVIDACRNAMTRSTPGQGLVQSTAAKGILQIFSTMPGARALDTLPGSTHSPFATAFVRNLAHPSLGLKAIAEQTQRDVDAMTGGTQIPWIASGLVGDVRLQAESVAPVVSPAAATGLAQGQTRGQAEPPPPGFWQMQLSQREQEIRITSDMLDANTLPLLQARARSGDIIAQTTLGMAYSDTHPYLRTNRQLAARYLQAAANRHFPIAETLLAELLYDGRGGVRRDLHKAGNLLSSAAASGYSRAQLDLISLQGLSGHIDPKALQQGLQSLGPAVQGYQSASPH